MASNTRSKPAASKTKDKAKAKDMDKDEPAAVKAATKKLDASVANPPQLFILPKDASPEARITTIPDPASATPTRYFICPEKGFFEFMRIAAPKRQHRSWLLASERPESDQQAAPDTNNDNDNDNGNMGYVLQAPDMFVATPIDPLFLLLPSLAGDVNSIGKEYLAPSDYSAKLCESSTHFSHILQNDSTRTLAQALEHRVAAVCDCMDMGDDKMYALSLPKLVRELVSKAKRTSARGLPQSIEDRFVKQALDVPILSIKREDSSISIATDSEATVFASETSSSTAQSQEFVASANSAASPPTAATSFTVAPGTDTSHTPDGVKDLLRLRVALDFLSTSYIAPEIIVKMRPLISAPQVSGIDFTILDKHLEQIARLKKEAQALRFLSDNISRKRNAMEDDDEAMDKAETKKRKKEEEETRKKNVSQGVKKLMKADTSGMKKLSSFFAKPLNKK